MSSPYLDLFRQRVNGSVGDEYTNSTEQFIEQSFKEAPNYKVVQINGVDYDVRVLTEKEDNSISNTKTLLFMPNKSTTPGSLVLMSTQHWLVVDYLDGLMPKAKVKLCNNLLEVQMGVIEMVTGTDRMGRPIIEKEPVYTKWKCVVESRTTTPYDNLNSVVNAPEGKLFVTIPNNDIVVEDMHFKMWGHDYKIIGVDRTKVIDGVGILTLTAQRQVGGSV